MVHITNDELLHRLKKEECVCPKCASRFSFDYAAAFAKFNRIKDNVIMCENCRRVYEIGLKDNHIYLRKDVTKNYPWIRAKRGRAGLLL